MSYQVCERLGILALDRISDPAARCTRLLPRTTPTPLVCHLGGSIPILAKGSRSISDRRCYVRPGTTAGRWSDDREPPPSARLAVRRGKRRRVHQISVPDFSAGFGVASVVGSRQVSCLLFDIREAGLQKSKNYKTNPNPGGARILQITDNQRVTKIACRKTLRVSNENEPKFFGV
jgi:hypothetical protein